MRKVRRPILRYHGGKWRLAPWIIAQIPEHTTYVEPFGGAGSVLLRKPRSKAEVYNDLDDEIVNVFKQVRTNGPELKELLRATPFSRREFKLAHVPTTDSLEQARRIIVRSFMGIGTDAITRLSNGFRSCSKRNCAADWVSYVDALDTLVERLQGVIIENRDWKQVLATHDRPDTLFYVDPPYVATTRTSAHGYKHEMTDTQHRELAAHLNTTKGKVILSGYDSPLYDELFKGWRKVKRPHRAFFGRPSVEVLWMNFSDGRDT